MHLKKIIKEFLSTVTVLYSNELSTLETYQTNVTVLMNDHVEIICDEIKNKCKYLKRTLKIKV